MRFKLAEPRQLLETRVVWVCGAAAATSTRAPGVKTIRAAHRRFPVLWQSPMLDAGTGQFPASPILWTVVGIALGVSPSLAQTYHMGALRSWSAISEVQTLLNPHVGSGDRPHPPQHGWWTRSIPRFTRAVDRGGNPLGGGDRGGGSPPPAQAGPGAGEPPGRQSREVFVENSGEIIHYEPSVRVS